MGDGTAGHQAAVSLRRVGRQASGARAAHRLDDLVERGGAAASIVSCKVMIAVRGGCVGAVRRECRRCRWRARAR